jgi:hypothetical protein
VAVAYAYAALVTMAVTALIVVFPIWQRGGREAVVDASPWLGRLFLGLAVIMVVLAVVLQGPAPEALALVLAIASASLAAYWLTRDRRPRSRWDSGALVAALVFSLAVMLVVVIGR